MQGIGVPASYSIPYPYSHSLDRVTEIVSTPASAAVSNIVGMIGTEAGLSVQNAPMKVRYYSTPNSPPYT